MGIKHHFAFGAAGRHKENIGFRDLGTGNDRIRLPPKSTTPRVRAWRGVRSAVPA
jgi:hypothetical protein